MIMQAWKIKYSQSNNPSARWTAGILGLSKEDALRHLQAVTKFPYQVENIEFLGEIHAITEPILMSVVKQRQQTIQKPIEKKSQDVITKSETDRIEEELQNGEIECQFCGKVCKGKAALNLHEQKCPKNPSFAKLEQARQEKRKAKLAEQEENKVDEEKAN